jgi:hypothetical protein
VSGAELLRRHADTWVQAFGKTAYVRMPTWGVVTHGIPVASIHRDGADITPELGRDMATQLAGGYPTHAREGREDPAFGVASEATKGEAGGLLGP